MAIMSSCNTANENNNSQSEYSERVEDLLSQMTLEEKVGQLNQYSVGAELTGPGEKSDYQQLRYEQLKSGQVGSVLNLLGAKNAHDMQKLVVENSRLGIPLIFAYDVIHGYKTMFPIPLGESCSWNLDMMKQTASIAAKEASAAGIQWTFAPMIDIYRDARWGRVMEGAGEDPYLGSEIAKARINGFQGDDLSATNTIAACAKHFAGYGFVESGKDYNNVYVGRNQLMNTIIPPFKAANEAGVATFMNAFNDIDGVPSTSNQFLLRDLLKDKWAFDGVVVSDWASIAEITFHGVAKDTAQAAEMAIEAGTDIDMQGSAYINHLQNLVESGEVDIAIIDDAVRRVLSLKEKLGLLDDPYKYFDEKREKETLLADEHREVARKAAQESIVLLKNEGGLLPLKSKKIAVIGPLAKDKDSPIGNWRGQGESGSAVSLYEGITAAIPDANFSYAKGCELSIGPNSFAQEVEIETSDRSGFAEAISVAKNAEVVIMALGETAFMSGEAKSLADISLAGLQLELLKEIKKVNSNIVLVLMNGRPLAIPWAAENIPAIVETWHGGVEAGNAIADVLTGKVNPSGKLTMSFPREVGQVPIYYNYKMTGRPYGPPGMVFYTHHGDVDPSPLYPFGFGLSYSTFEYSEPNISSDKLSANGKIEVSLNVKNTSEIDGKEIVQLYIRDVVGSITRPVLELKGFEKVEIKAGESVDVTFEITSKDLEFYNQDIGYVVEDGEFEVFVGPNSAHLKRSGFTYSTD